MGKQLFIFIFLLGVLHLNAQEKDTLANRSTAELKQLIVDNMRFEPKTAIAYSNYFLKKSEQDNNYKDQCSALSLMAESYRVLGDLDNALEHQISAEKLLDKVDDPLLKVSVYTSLGNIYSDLGTYDKVLPAYFEAIRISEANDFTLTTIAVKHNLAYFKDQIGAYDEALTILKESRKVILEKADSDSSSLFKNDMLQTMVFGKLHQPDSVFFYGNRALEFAKANKDQFSESGIYEFLGTAYAEKNQFDEAFKALNKADSMGVSFGNDIVLMRTRFALASVHYKVKDYDKVIEILENSIALTERKNLNYYNNDNNYKLLAKAYKEKGNYEKANYYFEKYIQKYDFNKDLHQIIDTGFNEKKVEEFRNELQQLKKAKTKQENYVLYLGLGAILLTLVLGIVLINYYRNKKRNELKFKSLHQKLNALKSDERIEIVNTQGEVLEETSASDVGAEVTQQILEGLQKLEKQEYFLKQDCNAYNVAKKIKTNTSYLSKVVNFHFQKNFNTYINDLRINYAIVRLENDTRFRSFSIQSIAEELGYKSADSFTKYFKQNTGLNPSFYIKQLNQLG